MRTPNFPTDEKIEIALYKVNKRLQEDLKPELREGFEMCRELLERGIWKEYFKADTAEETSAMADIYRMQLAPISHLKSTLARIMAIACVDWLNGSGNDWFLEMK